MKNMLGIAFCAISTILLENLMTIEFYSKFFTRKIEIW